MGYVEGNLARPQGTKFPTVKFGPRRLGHSNNFVGDAIKSAEFFVNVAGFEEVARELQIPAVFVSNGNTHHDLGLVQCPKGEARIGRGGHVQIPKGRGLVPGLNHMGWEMEHQQQLVEAYYRIKDSDVPIHRLVDHQTSWSVYIFDPDGILHEIYADQVKDWRKVLKGDLRHLTGSWNPEEGKPTTARNYHDTFELRTVPNAVFHPVKITHEVVVCENYDAMVAFYENVIGLTPGYRSPDGNFVSFHGTKSDLDVALFKPIPGKKSGMHHMAFQCQDEKDLDAAKAKLKAKNILTLFEVDNDRKRSIFVADPDGLGCEFYVRRSTKWDSVAKADLRQQPYFV
ncbi:MAG: VOC family protein [Alphaproteobacteria bacterium]|nr:VOC family protein [Alphaproteobacteria bacterium]